MVKAIYLATCVSGLQKVVNLGGRWTRGWMTWRPTFPNESPMVLRNTQGLSWNLPIGKFSDDKVLVRYF
jgi:hypothetical protein